MLQSRPIHIILRWRPPLPLWLLNSCSCSQISILSRPDFSTFEYFWNTLSSLRSHLLTLFMWLWARQWFKKYSFVYFSCRTIKNRSTIKLHLLTVTPLPITVMIVQAPNSLLLHIPQ